MKKYITILITLLHIALYPANYIILHEGLNNIEIKDYYEIKHGEIDSCKRYFDDFYIDTTGSLAIKEIIELQRKNKFLDGKNYSRVMASIQNPELKKAGFKNGDEIVKIGNTPISDVHQIDEILKANTDSLLTFQVLRNGSILNIEYLFKTKHLGYIPGNLHFIDTRANIWIHLKITKKELIDNNYLLEAKNAKYIEAYFFNNDSLIVTKKSGNDLRISERDFPLGNRCIVEMPNKECVDVLLMLKKTTRIEPVTLLISSKEQTIKQDRSERFANGLFFGIMLIMAIYNFIMLLSIKDRSYIYYVLYILLSGLVLLFNTGYGFELLFPNYPKANNIGTFLMFPSLMAFILFARCFLRLEANLPKWHKLFTIFIWAMAVFSLLIILISLIPNVSLVAMLGMGIFVVLIIIMFFATNIPPFLRVKQGSKTAIYFLIANLVLTLSFLFLLVSEFQFAIPIGITIQIVVFSIGLGKRISDTEKQKKQALEKIVAQLEENEKLKDKVNRELEQKVKERTVELELANEEVHAQRDSIEEQKEILEKINHEVEASINYALRIQQSVLPEEDILKESVDDYFILYKPRDIVSGDFYWFKRIKHFLIVTAADCTGHGVPGAFMSMLGVTFLNEVVSKSSFDTADEILNRLRDKVKKALKQKGNIGENKDGMDMSLCIINLKTLELEFAGAYNPLYIVRNKELVEIKANRMPIAVYYKEQPFTLNKYQLKKGDGIYMFSDGYADQFGGEQGRKFMSKRFKNLLIENSTLAMAEQHENLLSTFNNWKQGYEQMDDVIVLGIKI